MFKEILAQYEFGRQFLGGAYVRMQASRTAVNSWERVMVTGSTPLGLCWFNEPDGDKFSENASFIEELRLYS